METKTTIRFFTILDYDKEQEYLREMHKAGWRFTRLKGAIFYQFEKCEPEDVIYQLDYNQEAQENKDEYVQMFADCGWEYLQDACGYSYFRKPASETDGREEIFCDDESRLQMLTRIFKGRMVPLLLIFGCILMPTFLRNLQRGNPYAIIGIGFMLVLYLVLFVGFVRRYIRLKTPQ